MRNSRTNAQDAALNSTDHRFPWKWRLDDLKDVPRNGKTVFSCFSCGGGSSMGYKLAGYTVLGNCEIDPEMMKLYKRNHHPKYPYLMDIREFNRAAGLSGGIKTSGYPGRVAALFCILYCRGSGEGMGKGKGIPGRTEKTAAG